MANCTKCGTLISEGEFCPSCGTKMGNASETINNVGKLHCPNCKSVNISISTESSVNGSIGATRGGITTTTVSNTHRNYWFCSDCGTKFRNIQSLEEEIKKNKNNPTIMIVISIIAAIICLSFIRIASTSMLGFMMFTPIIVSMVTSIVCFCFIFVYKNRLKKMKEELQYLKYNCFN